MLRRRHAGHTARSVVGLLAALALVSCGGDADKAGGGAKPAPAYDADRLVEQASGPNPAARSGRIDGRVEIALEGVKEFAEPFAASVSGPFRYRKGSALPDYELEMGVRDYGAELSAVGGRSYVSIGSTGYEVPAAVRSRLKRKAAKGANGLTRTLEQFGIAPWRWETDRRVAGTERIDGVEVVHITTSFNAGRIIRDANTLLGVLASLGIARATGLPPLISRRARRLIVAGVQTKKGASWIGVKDRVIRRSGFTMTFTIRKSDRARLGGISGGRVVGELNVTQVGRPQRISAPETIGPFADFATGLDALGEAQERKSGG